MLKQFNILVLALVTVLALGLLAQADGQSDLAAHVYDFWRTTVISCVHNATDARFCQQVV